MIRGTGRTDFQNGDAEQLWASITQKLFALPEATVVRPGHDYRGHSSSTIGKEKKHNPRVAGKSKREFVGIMAGLNLPRPKYLDVAVPANKECGLGSALGEHPDRAFRELSAKDATAFAAQRGALVLDVREPHELGGELGAFPGSVNVPRGEVAQAALDLAFDTPIVVVCRSGRRSRAVCEILIKRGFRKRRQPDGRHARVPAETGLLSLRLTVRAAVRTERGGLAAEQQRRRRAGARIVRPTRPHRRRHSPT